MSQAIHSELVDQGYDIEGIVSWEKRSQYYAVGFSADELPSVDGMDPVDDPSIE